MEITIQVTICFVQCCVSELLCVSPFDKLQNMDCYLDVAVCIENILIGFERVSRHLNPFFKQGNQQYTMQLRPRSHLLYGEDTVAVRPLN